ncbi:MAG: TolC family outer membrane protein [Kiloniellales bacterium]|nr:TolC family outer membrane protein [Kiloniellales bacterium]
MTWFSTDETLNGCARATITLLGVALALAAWSGPARALTLEEALSAAYEENPTLRAARAQLRSVNEQVPQELSNWRPTVTVNTTVGQEYVDSDNSEEQNSTTPFDAEVVVQQPLYRGGRTVAGTRRAENDIRAERQRLRSTEQDVLFDAVASYMDVWRDEAVLRLTINNEQVLTRQLEASRDRFSVGEITRTDVAQSEARLAQATADRIQAEGNLAATRAVFREVIGLEPVSLARPPTLEDIPSNLNDIVGQARVENPDVQAAEFAERSARDEVRVRIGELLPSVALEGSLSRSEDLDGSDFERDQAQILAQVTVPLYQSGFVYSRVREAKQVVGQRRLEIDEARRRAEQEAVSAWERLTTARAQIESFTSQVRSNEIALEGVRQENAVGARTILDILDAEQELLDSQVELVRSERDEVVASYDVLSAVGRLTATEIALPVEIYDAESDYGTVKDRWFGTTAPGSGY